MLAWAEFISPSRNRPSFSHSCRRPLALGGHAPTTAVPLTAFSLSASPAAAGREYGAPPTVWRHLRRWSKEGVWARIWPAARAARAALDQQGKLDWSMAVLDGSVALAKNGGEKVGLTKKGKGATWMLVVEGNGLPPGFYLDRATPAEIRLADATLDYPLGPSPA